MSEQLNKLLTGGYLDIGDLGTLVVIRKGRGYNPNWRMESAVRFYPSNKLRFALDADSTDGVTNDGEKCSPRSK